MPRARTPSVAILLVSTFLLPGPVRAQSSSDQAAAEALFKQGRDLMGAGRYQEACGKLAESERLDPATGTVLNLATCYERNGQIASAWVTYKDAARSAQRAGQAERSRLARQKADELEPKLPTLVIAVSAASDRPDLEVKRDGEIVGRAGWNTPIPVDPGPHVVDASAPGRKSWQAQADISGPGARATLDVPPLEALPESPTPPTATILAQPPPVSVTVVEPPPADAPRGNSQRVAAFVVGGLGVAGAAAGAFFGVTAKSDNDNARNHCIVDAACDAQGISSTHDAQHAATYSTIAFVSAGALIAAGFVLYLTAPSDRRVSADRVRITPIAEPGAGGGAVLRGSW